jgi:cysteine desulfurase / selenocysteine lyase
MVEVERRERVRSQLADLIGADAADIALVANTTTGVVDIALCLPWQRGDRVIVFAGEFPTNITPWQQAARRHGLELVWQQADDFRHNRDAALESLEAELKRGVRLVAVSAVQFQTGLQMPLAAIGALCHRYGAELFVDAIQAVGVVPLDVRALGVHYLVAGSHKWLMAPEGVAMLYVAPTSAAALRPEVAGWTSHDDAFAFLMRGGGELRYDRAIVQTARMVEGGAPHTLAIAGLQASVALVAQLGASAIYDHVQAWHDALEPGLIARGFVSARSAFASGRSGILSLRPPGADGAPAWAAALAALGVSASSPDGWLRFAPHWPSAIAECVYVLEVVDSILAGGGPTAGTA